MAKKYDIFSEADFRKFYDTNLKPLYTSLKQKKSQILRATLRRNLTILLCLAVLYLFLWYRSSTADTLDYKTPVGLTFIFFIIGIFASVFATFYSDSARAYKNFAKELLLPQFINFFGTFRYGHYPVSRDIIEKSSLFSVPEFRNYFFEDCIKGKYKNTAIQIAEDYILNTSSLCMLINFPKKFSGKTVVYSSKRDVGFYILIYMSLFILFSCAIMYFHPETIPMFILCWGIGIYFYFADRKISKQNLQKDQMESINFSENWKVLTTNPVEARYILTPLLMEQMLQIKTLFKSHKVNFSFFDNKLLMVIHSRKNWFEIEYLSNFDYYKQAKNNFEQIKTLLSVVDILKPEHQNGKDRL